jgi:hypothetical protein
MGKMYWSARYIDYETGKPIGESFDLVPPYSTSIEAAWKIVEWLREQGLGVIVDSAPWNHPWVRIRNTTTTIADAVGQHR